MRFSLIDWKNITLIGGEIIVLHHIHSATYISEYFHFPSPENKKQNNIINWCETLDRNLDRCNASLTMSKILIHPFQSYLSLNYNWY